MKLSVPPTLVKWAASMSLFAVFSDRTINVYSLETLDSTIVARIPSPCRINCGACMTLTSASKDNEQENDVVVYGGEDKILRVASLRTGKVLLSISTPHQLRIKSLSLLETTTTTTGSGKVLLVTCSSEGLVCVWDIQSLYSQYGAADDAKTITVQDASKFIVFSYEAKCRLTCLKTVRGDSGHEKKQKRDFQHQEQARKKKEALEYESEYEEAQKGKEDGSVSVVFDDASMKSLGGAKGKGRVHKISTKRMMERKEGSKKQKSKYSKKAKISS